MEHFGYNPTGYSDEGEGERCLLRLSPLPTSGLTPVVEAEAEVVVVEVPKLKCWQVDQVRQPRETETIFAIANCLL